MSPDTVVHRSRVRHALHGDPHILLVCRERRDIRSLRAASRAAHVSQRTAVLALAEIGRLEAVQRLFRWRRRAVAQARRVAMLRQLRTLAALLGRTPTGHDIETAGRELLPSVDTYQRVFGSLRAAQRALRLTAPSTAPPP